MSEKAEARPGPSEERPDARPVPPAVLLVIVALVLVGWALKALAVVLIPLVAAILIALAVMPVRDRVRGWMPRGLRWLGIAAAMAVVLAVLGLFFGGLYLAGRQLVGKVPEAAEQVAGMLAEGAEEGTPSAPAGIPAGAQAGATDRAAAQAEGAADEGTAAPAAGEGGGASPDGGGGGLAALSNPREALSQAGDQLLGAAGGAAGAIMNASLSILGGLVLIVFLTLLLLIESGAWAQKALRVAGWRTEWKLAESAEVVAQKFRAYVTLQTGLGAATGLLYAVWLWIWGVDLILVWSLLTFLMNFIPSVGSVIAGVTTTAYVLVTKDLGTAALVGAGILSIEQVMGNVIAPQLQGRNIALSPLVVLVALVFWGWAWGVAGALLAVPVTFALMVLGAHVPALRPWALLLSDRTDMEGLDEVTRP